MTGWGPACLGTQGGIPPYLNLGMVATLKPAEANEAFKTFRLSFEGAA